MIDIREHGGSYNGKIRKPFFKNKEYLNLPNLYIQAPIPGAADKITYTTSFGPYFMQLRVRSNNVHYLDILDDKFVTVSTNEIGASSGLGYPFATALGLELERNGHGAMIIDEVNGTIVFPNSGTIYSYHFDMSTGSFITMRSVYLGSTGYATYVNDAKEVGLVLVKYGTTVYAYERENFLKNETTRTHLWIKSLTTDVNALNAYFIVGRTAYVQSSKFIYEITYTGMTGIELNQSAIAATHYTYLKNKSFIFKLRDVTLCKFSLDGLLIASVILRDASYDFQKHNYQDTFRLLNSTGLFEDMVVIATPDFLICLDENFNLIDYKSYFGVTGINNSGSPTSSVSTPAAQSFARDPSGKKLMFTARIGGYTAQQTSNTIDKLMISSLIF